MEKMEIVDERMKEEYNLVEVPTGSAVAIQTPDGRNLSVEFAIVELLNKVDKIEKQVM